MHIDSLSIEMFTRVSDRWTSALVEHQGIVSLSCPPADIVVADLFVDLVD